MVIGALVVLGFALIFSRSFAKPPPFLTEWADDGGFTILRVRRQKTGRSPLPSGHDLPHPEVYRVVVRAPDGAKLTAWIRCNQTAGMRLMELVWKNTAR